MPNERPFVPVEASERARKGLKPNLADCRRIREVWLERQRINQAPDVGHKSSAAWGYAIELRAVAEEEAECAIGMLARMRLALQAVIDANPAFRVGTIGAPGSESRLRQEAQIYREDEAREVLAEYEALLQE